MLNIDSLTTTQHFTLPTRATFTKLPEASVFLAFGLYINHAICLSY
jgi:hypothetical protein